MQYYYYFNQQLQSNHAIGIAKYYTGTPDDPGDLLGQWISGFGGNPYSQADPLKPGEYSDGNKAQNVKGIQGWRTCAFRLMKKDGTPATAKSSGSGLWLHDSWKAITSMCIGITDMV